MGKSSLPILNKTGRTISWDNSWDDLKYYNIKFEQDIFIKIFFELLFNEHLFKHNFYFNSKFFVKLKNFYLPHSIYNNNLFEDFKPFILSLITPTKIIFYFMKFHIIRSNLTTIVILKLFFPIRKKSIKKKKIKRRRKKITLLFRITKLLSFFFKEKQNIFKKKNF